ncbi:MAG TPA: 2-C-methyl-D-erythritol 4-phosphate cytidylyltransferase [Chitinophagaceae bacterium]|nr:2-C-methyl-D-erythritol 4-phosphate cytidylyltransferase [Chitinophagaceae bacterium]
MEILMHKYAIIVAAGTGTRMGGELPKQFQLLKGKPVLWYSVKAFTDSYDDVQLILVLPENHLEKGEQLVKEFPSYHIHVIVGGDTRFQSVKNGLNLVKDPSIVFVHDGVRCLVSADLIKRCYKQAVEKGSAIPAVTAIDSIRILENGSHFIKDKQQVRIIQTPQTFLSNILLPAFEQPFNESFTDEATVVEAFDKEIFLIEGEYDNIKITRPIDLLIAEKIIENRSAS